MILPPVGRRRLLLLLLLLSIVSFFIVPKRVTADSAAQNPVTEFRAKGSDKDGNTINISNLGGDLFYKSSVIHLIPWHTRQWSSISHPYWLFYLVNVTGNDFYIGYLYLDNIATGPFGLYLLHYADGAYNWIGWFTGEQFVGSSIVFSPNIGIPALSIQPEAKFPNTLFVSGPSLEIVGNEGKFKGRQIYSLLNLYNVTKSSNDWNELWVVEADGKNYYYGIFYMFNNDHSNVYYAYELRLDDFAAQYTQSRLAIPAKWELGLATPIPEFGPSLPKMVLVFIALCLPGIAVRYLKAKSRFLHHPSDDQQVLNVAD
ncbi:hypothetical protein MUP05_11420 [Candidatus Bathyarchaeota archaeon]|nr:hypothetical protein [Candidatus Bathyarchaeota archaeon]